MGSALPSTEVVEVNYKLDNLVTAVTNQLLPFAAADHGIDRRVRVCDR